MAVAIPAESKVSPYCRDHHSGRFFCNDSIHQGQEMAEGLAYLLGLLTLHHEIHPSCRVLSTPSRG